MPSKEEKIVKKFMHMIRVDNPYYLLKNLLIDDYDDKQFTLLKKSDLIIICAPVKKYDEIFKVIDKNISENAIVSDIGSIKTNITTSLDNSVF